MRETIHVLLSEEEVNQRIAQMAAEISKDFEGQQTHLVCILKGSIFFTCELAKRLTIPVSIDFMSVSSYGMDAKSSGVVKVNKDLDEDIEGLNVLVVEDIIDSGRTLHYLLRYLKSKNPKSLKLCALLDKPEQPVAHDKLIRYAKSRIIHCHVRYTLFRFI